MLSLLMIMLSINLVYPGDYQKLTQEESIAWMQSLTLEELAEFVSKYDYIEHIDAEVIMPARVILLEDGNLYITYMNPMIIEIGHLNYTHIISDEIINDFYMNKNKNRRRNIITGIIIGAVCFVGGGLTFVSAFN